MFWAKGYYVNTVGGNDAKDRKYIQEQEFNDGYCDQLSFRNTRSISRNVADFDGDDSPEVPQYDESKSDVSVRLASLIVRL